jgi:hypothetical protein
VSISAWCVFNLAIQQPDFNQQLSITTKAEFHLLPIMGLVDYSDSDASDIEETPAAKPVSATSKPAFQKVVDRSNPGKIKVSLPQATLKDASQSDEPPTKRAKTGGGTFGGFNSFLPAPKRTGQATTGTLGGGIAAKKGLGSGVNLKTGSAPGFSREPEPEREYKEDVNEAHDGSDEPGLGLPPPKSQNGNLTEEVKLVGKPLMFRPLSVPRKPVKKKKAVPTPEAVSLITPATPATPVASQKPPRPKVSLFSMTGEVESPALKPSVGEYKPMMYDPSNDADEVEVNGSYDQDPSYEDYTPTTSHMAPPPAVPTPPVSQSLNDIAGDLHLSAAERRQLFGRQKAGNGKQAATKVINFNTDQEYLHNEELRASGEKVVHNPVRAIAPGKHSLKQLVNAAQSQKDALEESFAKGKSNRAEASSRYGW